MRKDRPGHRTVREDHKIEDHQATHQGQEDQMHNVPGPGRDRRTDHQALDLNRGVGRRAHRDQPVQTRQDVAGRQTRRSSLMTDPAAEDRISTRPLLPTRIEGQEVREVHRVNSRDRHHGIISITRAATRAVDAAGIAAENYRHRLATTIWTFRWMMKEGKKRSVANCIDWRNRMTVSSGCCSRSRTV